jgi:negative regulator of sigma-B (phosphoserine phosphatase)
MTQLLQAARAGPIEFAFAGDPLEGETVSGDLGMVRPAANGSAVIGLVDGIGHGPLAAEAAKIAITTLGHHVNAPIESMLKYCHTALKGTRGAVLTVAAIDSQSGTMTWLGVGNVEGRLLRADRLRSSEHMLLAAGIAGYDLPALRASRIAIFPGDVVILATDGIDRQYDTTGCANKSPAYIANHIVNRYRKLTDDALVLVARCSGIKR